MSVAVGEIYRSRMACYAGNQLGLMISHWLVIDVVGGATIDGSHIATRLAVVQNALIKALIGTTTKYLGHGVQRVFPAVDPEQVNTINSGYGTQVTDNLPRQVSGIFTLRSGFIGRANRGRQYMPFPTEGDNPDQAAPSVPYVDALQNLANTYSVPLVVTVGLESATLRAVVYRRLNPAASPIVLSTIARGKWATQRRRGNYGRPNDVPFGVFP